MHPMLSCPHCHTAMSVEPRELVCASGHHFDRAKEGFCNLLRPGRARKQVIGDDAEMVASRRRFLERGHYRVLSEGLARLTSEVDATGRLLDVGCGEGSVTRVMATTDREASVAFDISRPAVRLAARRAPDALCLVASVIEVPVADDSVDLLVSVMSPIHTSEFVRLTHPGSRAIIVHPGSTHLGALRRLVYADSAKAHDEAFEIPEGWRLVDEQRFTDTIQLTSSAEVMEVWGMTPYRWNSPREGGARVEATSRLELDVHFVASVLEVC